MLRGVDVVVVVDSGIVEVVDDVVVASELPRLVSAILKPNAIREITTRTAAIRAIPPRRHCHVRRAAV